MGDTSWLTVGLGLAGFIANIIVLAVIGTHAIAKMELRLSAERAKDRIELNDDVATLRREFGESLLALRTKINEVELYIRDHYLSKETFNLVIQNFASEMKALSDRFDVRMLRMENKIDKVLEKQ